MSGENWTPGPWTPFGLGDDPYPGVDSLDTGVSIIIFGEEGEDVGIKGRNDEEIHANAHLIAAAPELYEALKATIQCMPEQVIDCAGSKCREPWCIACNPEDEASEAVEQSIEDIGKARKALAKARGEDTCER